MAYTYEAVVHRVVDGDTIVANVDLGFGLWRMAQSFRVLGINAREKSQDGGLEASAHLSQVLPHGSKITLRSIKNDKYGGRFDAYITLADGTDLGSALVRAGWAAKWDGSGERPLPVWPRSGSVP